MVTCPVCHGPMKPLATTYFCPNDCDRKATTPILRVSPLSPTEDQWLQAQLKKMALPWFLILGAGTYDPTLVRRCGTSYAYSHVELRAAMGCGFDLDPCGRLAAFQSLHQFPRTGFVSRPTEIVHHDAGVFKGLVSVEVLP